MKNRFIFPFAFVQLLFGLVGCARRQCSDYCESLENPNLVDLVSSTAHMAVDAGRDFILPLVFHPDVNLDAIQLEASIANSEVILRYSLNGT